MQVIQVLRGMRGCASAVEVKSGDNLDVLYVDPDGNRHIININAQHLTLMVSYEKTGATMLIGHSTGVQYIKGSK
jgi:hypothetical protein